MAVAACSPLVAEGVRPDVVRVIAPGGRVAISLRGSGEPMLVFLHDLGGTMEVWEPLLAKLGAWSGSMLLMDLRGHGASEAAGDGDYRVPSVALDVVSVLERQEAASFVLVGHGWGGHVALRVAAAMGGRVKGVFLLDAMPEVSQFPVEQQRAMMERLMDVADGPTLVREVILPGTDGLSAEEVERVMRGALSAGRGVITAIYEGLYQNRALEDLAGFRGAVLAVVSDANTGPLSLQNLTEDLPYRVVEGRGHYLMLTATNEVAEILTEWLTRVR